jgi:ferredoxin-nitrite reductase
MSDESFSEEQQAYLKGVLAGVAARRGAVAGADPRDLQRAAQDAVVAAGGTLVAEEEAKRRDPPLDRFDAISATARDGRFPKGTDVFLTKFHGLFYVAPAQNSFMCRLRIPGGILNSFQLRGVAAIAAELGGGFADITTRANLQIREIPATAPPEVLMRLAEIGLTSRGSGADNVRNVTGSPTAGIDAQELVDTRPHTRALHHFILQHRELYGLPRKFNVAYDGGGRVPVLEDTNDIAFSAVRVLEGASVPAGVYYRLGLGGITGHRDFARPTGVVVPVDETIPVCNAILRVFIREGDRTNRTRARLKYVLDRMGVEGFLQAVEAALGTALMRVEAALVAPRPVQDRGAHIGVHQQKDGRFYIGVVCPVGRLTSERLRGLADVAERFGSGTIRLTVWQNLLISDVAADDVAAACTMIGDLGLATQASSVQAGLVACTGNAGCKFSASDTKGHAAEIAAFLDARIALDRPLNIHLTGCHHSCAQHYIADIGLLAVKIEDLEGYDVHIGGGAGAQAKIGRLIRAGVSAAEVPGQLLGLLQAWKRSGEDVEFHAWSARFEDEELAAMLDRVTEDA